MKKRSVPTPSPRRLLAVAVGLAFLGSSPLAWAFDPGIHETVSETVLRQRGFDADSADEAGDSNYWTDSFESSNSSAHADNNNLGGASQRLNEKIARIRTSLDQCKRRDALDALGEALHTVQDIYSHSNAVDNNHPVDLLNLVNGTATCSLPNFAPGGLVTGYFSVSGWFMGNQCKDLPAGTCCHRDLNKDNPGANNGARHPAARAAAQGATNTYAQLVEDDIRANFGAERAELLIKTLKRKQRTTFFVIDDTGSMSQDIAGVKAAVGAFLDQMAASDEAPTLGLVSYKDSPRDFGPTCDIEQLRAQVNSLFASGGGDCPEAMNAGLLTALNHFPPGATDVQLAGGRILLATDASAGDPGLGPTVAGRARALGVSIDAILTGDCVPEELTLAPDDPLTSPSARTYLRALTAQTGGVLFNVQRPEVDDVVPTLLELNALDSAVVLSRPLDSESAPATLAVPVDETLETGVTFMLTAATPAALATLTLERPDGSVVSPSDPGVTRRRLTTVDSYRISAPTPGLWRATATGGVTGVLRAFGPSALRVNGLRYFATGLQGPRPEMPAPPLQGQPVAGTTVTSEVRLSSAPDEAAIRLLRADGSFLQDLPTTSTDGRRLSAPLTVPAESFLVEVTGTSPGGFAFVRHVPGLIVPRTVSLAVDPPVAVAAPGTTATLTASVRNLGSVAATLTLQSAPSLPWPVGLPGTFEVPAGATVAVPVTVQVPAGTPEGTRDDIDLTVEDLVTPGNRNSTSIAVVAGVVNQSPVCTAAKPTPSRLWPPFLQFEPIAISGVTDADGDAVTLTVTGITQDEPLTGFPFVLDFLAPDGKGVGTPTARLRAERSIFKNGRVYEVRFQAQDGNGGTCDGSVKVSVPLLPFIPAVDSGQAFDSTAHH
jgi:von Willebrand factor type A domain